MDKVKRYLEIANQVFQIEASDASAEAKYELIFSAEGSQALERIFPLDYYCPDTSYEEDVQAFVAALRVRCADLQKIDVAIDTEIRVNAGASRAFVMSPAQVAKDLQYARNVEGSNVTRFVPHVAFLTLAELVAAFITATEMAGREAMQWMSIDQVRIYNQLCLAVGK